MFRVKQSQTLSQIVSKAIDGFSSRLESAQNAALNTPSFAGHGAYASAAPTAVMRRRRRSRNSVVPAGPSLRSTWY